MASINIPLPADLRRFVDARAKSTKHATPTEYIHSLILEDQKRAEQEHLEKLLQEGVDSGLPIDASSREWWEKRQQQLLSDFERGKPQ